MKTTFDEYEKSGKKWELFVQPLTSIRLYSSNIYNRLNSVGNITTIKVLIGVEIFIILLSCINFMNLSTAQYTRRIKESSIRKILGSDKWQLSLHFFAEAFMYCLISAAIAVGIVQLLLPLFSYVSGVQLSFDLAFQSAVDRGGDWIGVHHEFRVGKLSCDFSQQVLCRGDHERKTSHRQERTNYSQWHGRVSVCNLDGHDCVDDRSV